MRTPDPDLHDIPRESGFWGQGQEQKLNFSSLPPFLAFTDPKKMPIEPMLQSSQYYIFYCAEPEPCVRPDPIKNAYCADVDSNSLLAFFLGTNALGVHSPQRALLYLLN